MRAPNLQQHILSAKTRTSVQDVRVDLPRRPLSCYSFCEATARRSSHRRQRTAHRRRPARALRRQRRSHTYRNHQHKCSWQAHCTHLFQTASAGRAAVEQRKRRRDEERQDGLPSRSRVSLLISLSQPRVTDVSSSVHIATRRLQVHDDRHNRDRIAGLPPSRGLARSRATSRDALAQRPATRAPTCSIRGCWRRTTRPGRDIPRRRLADRKATTRRIPPAD